MKYLMCGTYKSAEKYAKDKNIKDWEWCGHFGFTCGSRTEPESIILVDWEFMFAGRILEIVKEMRDSVQAVHYATEESNE